MNSIVSNLVSLPGTMRVDPQFVSPSTNNFHIMPTSPAKDAVDMGPPDDFEGNTRPCGPKFDIGADEVCP